jgi:chromosome segregation ATPase
MLEELDHLELRIRALVERVKTLDLACATLRREVASLTQERDLLNASVSEANAELGTLRLTVGQAESVAQAQSRQAQEKVAQIQGTLDLFLAEKDVMESNLKSRDNEVQRLRALTREAQTRIDGVLERLPGALVQGQS